MPNNSCTIILNGQGPYSKDYIINTSSINYHIIFPCGMNETISAGHHNFLLSSFVRDITWSFNRLESLPTTSVSNRNITPQSGIVIDMLKQHNNYLYDHELSNAPDMKYKITSKGFLP